MTEIISRVLPILLLITIGFGLRRSKFIFESTIGDLRKLVVNLASIVALLTRRESGRPDDR